MIAPVTISHVRTDGASLPSAAFEPIRRAALVATLSQALDLAEGREYGHAQRVAYIANVAGESLGFAPHVRRTAFYAALLHDAGVAAASARIYEERGREEQYILGGLPPMEAIGTLMGASARFPNIERALHLHTEAGADMALQLGFDDDVAEAVRHHHAWWNGYGFPIGKRGDAVPAAARLVAFADLTEQIIAEQRNPLSGRAAVIEKIMEVAGQVLDPVIACNVIDICGSDRFWIEIYSPELPRLLIESEPADATRVGGRALIVLAETFSRVIDAASGSQHRHASPAAVLAEELALAIGLPGEHAYLVRLAGLLHNVGQAGMPNRIMAKPDIFTVEELELLAEHPRRSREILQTLPAFDEIGVWAESHHEWMDGRGYPNGISGAEIPLESRILAIADSFCAITSDRPHRPALSDDDALIVMSNAAGTQFDELLFDTFAALIRGRRAKAG